MKTCRAGLHQYEGKRCRECKRAHDRARHLINPEKFHARNRARRLANPEKFYAPQRAWRKANRGYYHARRARKRLAPTERYTPAQWQQVVDFYGGLCAYCGAAPWEHRDHVVPLALEHNSADAIYNLVPACATCNLSKRAELWPVPVEHPWMFA